jgi:hypothetical protein
LKRFIANGGAGFVGFVVVEGLDKVLRGRREADCTPPMTVKLS